MIQKDLKIEIVLDIFMRDNSKDSVNNQKKIVTNLNNFFVKLKISDVRKRVFLSWIVFIAVLIIFKNILNKSGVYLNGLNLTFNFIIGILIINLIVDFSLLVIISSYRKKYKLPKEHYDNFTVGMTMLTYILKFLIFVYLLFYIFKIDVQVFFASLALFSVALAWLFKEYIDNLLDGIIISFSNNFKIKDYIKIDDYKGRINFITLQNIELKTDEGDIVYIPNTLILEKPVINYSKINFKTIDFEFSLPFYVLKNFKKLINYIEENVSKEFSEVLDKEKFDFKINEIEKNYIKVTLNIPVNRYNFAIEDKIKKHIGLIVIDFLNGDLKIKYSDENKYFTS